MDRKHLVAVFAVPGRRVGIIVSRSRACCVSLGSVQEQAYVGRLFWESHSIHLNPNTIVQRSACDHPHCGSEVYCKGQADLDGGAAGGEDRSSRGHSSREMED